MRLIGVTSHAYDNSDCDETGGVDTRVDAYLGWIDGELRARCEDGSRAWCEEEGIPVPGAKDVAMDSGDTGEEDDDKKGCGCASSPSAPAGLALLGLVGLVALRRRR